MSDHVTHEPRHFPPLAAEPEPFGAMARVAIAAIEANGRVTEKALVLFESTILALKGMVQVGGTPIEIVAQQQAQRREDAALRRQQLERELHAHKSLLAEAVKAGRVDPRLAQALAEREKRMMMENEKP